MSAAADLLGTGASSRRRVAGAAVALAVLTLFFNLRYLAVAPALTEEEHYRVGEHFHATGILSIDDTPAFFRPPGFPVFVAMLLHLRDALAPGLEGRRVVALAQGCLLSLGAVALFLYTSRTHPLPVALAVGILYSFNPLNLFIARVVTYYTLHIVLVTVATIALSYALQTGRRRMVWAVAAGVLWGVATLVRPVSLILPPFVFLLARWIGGKGSWRSALRFSCVFTIGMVVVIAPFTVRNYRLSHRLIVVNVQAGWQFWGLSATRNPFGDIAEWGRLWKEEGEPIFKRVTGSPYSIETLYEHELALNDAFGEEAARNIRRAPWRYAFHVVGNLVAFNLDSSHRWLDRLDHVREGWDWPPREPLGKAFSVTMLLLGVAGVVRGLRDRETDARVIVTIYAMFLVAHSLVLLLSRYSYVRLPLLLLALPLLLRGVEKNRRASRALLVAVIVATASVWELSIR